jgi:hypothetical protein
MEHNFVYDYTWPEYISYYCSNCGMRKMEYFNKKVAYSAITEIYIPGRHYISTYYENGIDDIPSCADEVVKQFLE